MPWPTRGRSRSLTISRFASISPAYFLDLRYIEKSRKQNNQLYPKYGKEAIFLNPDGMS